MEKVNGMLKISFSISRPGIPLVLALMIGIGLGAFLPPPYDGTFSWGLLLLLALLPLAILLSRTLFLFLAGLLVFLTGLSLTTILSPRILTPQVPSFLINVQFQHLSGEIVQDPLYYPDRTRLFIRLKTYTDQGREQHAQGIILLGIKGVLRGVNRGDPVRFVCRLRPIEGYHNPGCYDFEDRMAQRGIRVSGFLDDPALLVLSGPNQESFFWQYLFTLRNRVSDLIDNRLPPPVNGLAQALLTGDQSKIPRPVQESFSRAGVSHLLAFSGLNLTLIGGLSYYLFRFLFSLSETLLLSINVRRWALIGTFFPVLGYTLLAGLSPSAARALYMVTMVIIALLFNKFSDLLNSLALAAMILLLLAPESLFLPSFQLSFLAVWAIGYLLPRIFNAEAAWGARDSSLLKRVFFYLWGTFCVSLVCLLATLPVIAWWFHQVSLIGLISNIILVPLTGVLATPIGLMALVCSPLSASLSQVLFWILDLLIRWTMGLTRFFADLPCAHFLVPRPGWGEIIFYYAFLVALFNWRKGLKQALGLSFLLLGMTLCFLSPQIRDFFWPSFKTTFLDVGHGSAVLAEFPDGKKMLIDGGGSFNPEFDLGERVVAPYLWGEKITTLDTVVLTHPHPDHMNGLPFILSKFKVRELWLNGQEDDSEAFGQIQEIIRQKQIPVFYPKPGWSGWRGDVRIEVLNAAEEEGAPEKFSAAWRSYNNGSLVLRLSRGDQHILLTADIEATIEKKLLERRIPLSSQILQIPHHGSLSSSTPEFIRAVHPVYGFISARPSRHMPLPRPEILQRYESRGVQLFRTDRDGAITCELKPKGWTISSFRRGILVP
jgi:competence protein ComEC